MLAEHPAFDLTPEPENILRRYMSLETLVWMLENKALWFARTDSLKDKFEGSLSELNSPLMKSAISRFPIPLGIPLIADSVKKSVFVNCWHCSEHESFGMWEIYGIRGLGLALKTNFEKLKEAFPTSPEVYGSKIKYIDYSQESVPEGNVLYWFLRKRMGFEYEKEFRLATMKSISDDPDIETGLRVEVDLRKLIQEIVLRPGSQDFHKHIVQGLLRKYEVDIPVVNSSLDRL